MQHVVVTGVSSGIGWGCLKAMTAAGLHVFGSVRRAEDGARLSAEFGDRFTPLLFDVTDEAAVARAADGVRERLAGVRLLGLVNNAGIAVAGPLLHLPLEDWRRQMEVNVTGVVIATRAFAPLLGAAPGPVAGRPGRIVNISSVGGRTATPFLGPYCASKFAVEGLSDALRRELLVYGVDVSVVAPGAVATAIWDKAEEMDVAPYAATPFAGPLDRMRDYMRTVARKGLPPERVGRVVLTALTTPRPKTRYTVTPEPLQNLLVGALPPRVFDRLLGGQLGLLPVK